jgi:hypothetical protein
MRSAFAKPSSVVPCSQNYGGQDGATGFMRLMGPKRLRPRDLSPFTSHLSLLTSHDIGVASTCGSLRCSSTIFRAAAVTSASVKSALTTTVA